MIGIVFSSVVLSDTMEAFLPDGFLRAFVYFAIMEIIHASYLISSPSVDKCPKPDKPEYAFIGRSNVGKSSLINMLCNKKELAKVSRSPGKTQLINHFSII